MPALSINDNDILEQVRQFLLAVLPSGVDAIQGQDNRVPEPIAGDFVVMTSMNFTELSTARETFQVQAGEGSLAILKPIQWKVQLDVHGDNSASNAATIALAWKSAWAAAFLDGTPITPLYADDPIQAPFMNAEEQYETRWTVTIYLQANPVLTMPQDYATSVGPVQLYEADQ
jgi:hypothetical protein